MWAVAVSVYLAAVFHRTGLAVASLDAERRFSVGPSALAGLVAVQLGLYAAMQIPTGAMADRFGPRRMLVTAAAVMAVGETVFAVSGTLVVAVAGRALVGVGDALTFLSVLRLVQNWFPVSSYGLLAALTGLVGSVGQLVSTAPLRAGLSDLGWTATFGASALVTAAIGAAVWLGLRDRPATAAAPSPAPPPAPHAPVDGLVESVRAVMARRGTWRGMCAHFTLTAPYVVFTALWGYPFLVRAQHLSGPLASDDLAAVVVAAVIGAPLVGVAIQRFPGRRPVVVYGVAGTLLVTWTAVLGAGPGHDPTWLVAVLLVATGVGNPASAVAFDLAREANPPRRGGAATGVVNIGGFTGAVVADLVVGAVLGVVGHGAQRPADFAPALAVVPALIVVGLLGFWWFGRTGHAPRIGAAVGHTV